MGWLNYDILGFLKITKLFEETADTLKLILLLNSNIVKSVQHFLGGARHTGSTAQTESPVIKVCVFAVAQ